MKAPKVTALITVYNGEAHIQHAVESLLCQTLNDIEVLVIDDCSDDETLASLSKINDVRLRVIESAARLKRAKALNLGCEEAQGEYIAILDADDYSYPDRLEKQLQFFEQNTDHVWLGTAEERLDSQRNEHVVRQYPLNDVEIRRMASKCIPYCHSSVMFKKSLIEQGCNYDPSIPYLIDFEFFLRAAQFGKVANLPDALSRRDIRHESYFQGQFRRADQNKYLAQLSLRSIRMLKTPFWLALNPMARLIYPMLPEFAQKLLRKVSGLKDEKV